MKRIILGVFVLMLSYPANCLAYSGNEWGQWDDITKAVYVAAVLDAFQFSAINLDIPKGVDVIHDMQKEIIECAKDMTPQQMGAIVKKYVEKHPQDSHRPMSVLVYRAFTDTCAAK